MSLPARLSQPGPSGLLLGEVAEHRQLEVPALEALDDQDDPADEEGEQDQAEQGADGPRHVGPDHPDQGPEQAVGDRLHGVEADLGALVDQEEDEAGQPGDPGEPVGQPGGHVLGHPAAGRPPRVLATPPAGLLAVAARLLAVPGRRLAPALATLGWGRRRSGGALWGRGARGLPAGGAGGRLRLVGRALVGGRPVGRRLRPAKGLTRRLVLRVAWGRPLGHGRPPVVWLGSPGRASRSTPTRTGGAGTPSSRRPAPRPPSSFVGGGTPAIEPAGRATPGPARPSARP